MNEFRHDNEKIDAIGASSCKECGALVHVYDEDRHLEWHVRTTVHVGTSESSNELDPCMVSMIDETSTRLYRCRHLSGHEGPHRSTDSFGEPVVWPGV